MQIALCSGEVVVAQGCVGSIDSITVRLMFATSMLRRTWFAVTQSMPQMMSTTLPTPASPSTRTANTFVPGATPTTPAPLLSAPIVPAMWVPWPLPSCGGVPRS